MSKVCGVASTNKQACRSTSPMLRNRSLIPRKLAALHEEIGRLPESQRQALVLCMLEESFLVEAAQEIGCGEATVRRRLASARERLQALLREDLVAPGLLAFPCLADATARTASGPLTPLAAAVLKQMASVHFVKVAAYLFVITLGTAGGAHGDVSEDAATADRASSGCGSA